MSDSLADRLAARLDIQPEHTDRLIRTLAQVIHTQASRDGQVRVPGLGVFQLTEDHLSFEPDARFADAVNPKYAHLFPVSVVTSALPYADEPSQNDAELATYGDASPAVDADEVALFHVSPPVPFDPDDVLEEERDEQALLPDEEFPESELAVTAKEPPPLPDEASTEDAADGEDEIPAADHSEEEEEAVFDTRYFPFEEEPAGMDDAATDEAPAEEDDEYDFFAGLLADQATTDKEDLPPTSIFEDDDVADEEVENNATENATFKAPDYADAEADAALLDESTSFEEDTFLEESEPSAWAPPGTRWSGTYRDQLVPIDDEADSGDENDEIAPPVEAKKEVEPPLVSPSPLHALPTPPASKKPTGERGQDLPPRPSPHIHHFQNPPPKRSVWPWLLSALLFVVIAGGAYYYFNLREQPIAANQETPTVATVQPEDTTQASIQPTGDDPVSSDSTGTGNIDAPIVDDSTETSPVVDTPPARTGTIDRAVGGYTLVVGSRGSREQAEADAARVRQALNDDTIPVDVLQGTADGTTRFRIGVGQEPNIDAAVALKQRLGNRITADAWVTRILPDS